MKGSKLLNFNFISYCVVFQKKKDWINQQDGNLHDLQGQFKEEILSLKACLFLIKSTGSLTGTFHDTLNAQCSQPMPSCLGNPAHKHKSHSQLLLK